MDDPAHAGASVKRQRRFTHDSTPRYRQVLTAYVLGVVVLLVAYPFVPSWAQLTFKYVTALTTLPALAIGARRISPGRRAPWILLLAALAILNLNNAVRLLPGDLASTAEQLLDALGNIVVLSAALQLISQQGPANLGGIIDTSIAALAVGGLLWALVFQPHLTPAYRTHAAMLALFIVVFALSGVLGALAQMIVQRGVPALWFLVLALALALVADIIDAVTTNNRFMTTASMMTTGAYAAIALFGLDPTAKQLATPAPARPDTLSRGRLILLGLAVSALPVMIGAVRLAGGPRHAVLLVVSAASITTLVMLRIGQVSAQRDLAEATLRHEATHDPLTGLLNRKEFTRQVRRELTRGHPSGIIFCDLNRFKAINDRFGHTNGDQVLVEVAERLRTCLPADGFVSRLGGDEFVILLRNTTAGDLEAVNQRVRSAVDRPVVVEDQSVRIGIATGTAFADNPVDPDDLIERADHDMYLKKTNAEPGQGRLTAE